jgi:2-polyprenyl-3-methyl-5-hydroxy-6-metoxy-1,4-benzoquinol methylase
VTSSPHDKGNGYDEVAEQFMSLRNDIGATVVRKWSGGLPPGSAVLDLGCGHGVPVAQVLTEEGFTVYGVDASMKLIHRFRERFPDAHAECAAVEESNFFGRTFEGIVSIGLMFLLADDAQPSLIHKIANALVPGGRLLFTAPKETCTWNDLLTGWESVSLGAARYRELLDGEGLSVVDTMLDEGNNFYYAAVKAVL